MDPPPVDPPPMDPPEDEMPPPVDPDPPADPPVPTDVERFAETLHPLLVAQGNFCVGCHGAFQVPIFAVADVTDSYNVLTSQQKVSLQPPEASRVYLRAATDRHNCGGEAECDRIAAEFLTAIQQWANLSAEQDTPPEMPANAAVSAVVTFADAQDANLPRSEDNLLVRFDFTEGSGDTSAANAGLPITLELEGTEWLDNGALRIVSGKAQSSLADSQQISDAIIASGAYSVEAWVIPENTAQDGPARILSLSNGTQQRNFTLGQNGIYYQLRNSSGLTSNNGTPALEAIEPQVVTELTHVVATFSPAAGRSIYINGQLADAENTPDTLNWQRDRLLVLGNETSNGRLWMGDLHQIAIHTAALTPAQVAQNFDAGIGTLVTLAFSLDEALGSPGTITLVAQQLDERSYLFARPVYSGELAEVPLKNMRIAVNGTVPVAAQAFRRLDTMALPGAELSPLGAVIPAALGAEQDQLQLVFETLGAATGAGDLIAPAAPPPPLPDVAEPDYGIRSFTQVNDTFAALTEIPLSNSTVRERFAELRGQLPGNQQLLSFSPASQIAIQRLAVTYCGEITSNNGRCVDFFGECRVDGANKGSIGSTLFDRFVGAELAVQPMRAPVELEISNILDDLGCATSCDGTVAQTALTASCAAVLASSAVTVH